MNYLKPALLLGLFVGLLACQFNRNISEAVAFVDVNGKSIPEINVDLLEESSTENLTEWFENFELIELETTEESMIQYVMRKYIGEQYIVISTLKQGVLLFDREGKFMKALAPHGKGPGEVSDANRNIFVDEQSHKVYITDSNLHRDRVLCVDVPSNDFEYIDYKNTGKESHIRDVVVVNDTLMYVTTMPFMAIMYP